MMNLPPGLYDLLHTTELRKRIEKAGLLDRAIWGSLDIEELPNKLAILLSREISSYISQIITGKDEDTWQNALTKALQSPQVLLSLISELLPESRQVLHQIKPPSQLTVSTDRPDTPLSVSALLTGSSRSPALHSQLKKELTNCDRSDWLVSFIKYSGILPLMDTLRQFTQNPSLDGEPKLRIATTSYMGATDVKAIEELLKLPNTEIRISYDTKRTRLHAKAYLFHRATGFSSAYIGSANVSKAALDEGLEWTAKISQYESEHLWRHAVASFESHWEDNNEFTPCLTTDIPKLRQALAKEQTGVEEEDINTFFNLQPFGYQKAILEDIAAERAVGKHKHLVISATGTGKTMIAAFDYKNYSSQVQSLPRLLFVAHREEILKQARASYRQVLRDGSFGDIMVGVSNLSQEDYLFCTVQSWNSRNLSKFPPDHFDYVVLDEAHHAAANSYQNLIQHINPKVLLGLTATPERMDGRDIRNDFGGAFTHEVRLPEAIERALLSPFHYYGIPDLEGLDFTAIAWKRGGYDISQLSNALESNSARANWVMSQVERYAADMKQVRGLGFCVSIRHAEFMADYCNKNNVPAIALTGESPRDLRQEAQRKLEQYKINFIFTVDLYNEGVDIPSVNTIIFLRPTESLTLFLQQLGRGLRIHDEKSHLAVLDFIAPQHHNFSFTKRFQSLSSRPDLRVDKQIESGMPFVPAGCLVHLERQAREYVLNNIRSATARLRGERLLGELRQLRSIVSGHITLQQILDYLHLDTPDEIYKRGIPHVLLAKTEGNQLEDDLGEFDSQLSNGFRRIALMDDTHLMQDAKRLLETGKSKDSLTSALIHSVLWSSNRPEDGSLQDAHRFIASKSGLLRDLKELLDWVLEHRIPLPEKNFDNITGPLNLHASYTREQIILALGVGSFDSPRSSREGLLHVPERKVDAFFADINKSESDFSPTTMYDDYAITDSLFHWQSQSGISENTPTGQRYINHSEQGYTPLLFIRNRKKLFNGLTSPYLYAGPLSYQRHEGSKPMSIIWKLEYALPAKVLAWARRE